MLNRYAATESSSVEQVEAWLQSDYPGARCTTSADDAFVYRFNTARLPRLGLVFSSCSSASEAILPPAGFLRQTFPLKTPSQITIGRQTAYDVSGTGCVIPPDEIMRIAHHDNYMQLTLRIDLSVLNTALAFLLGYETQGLTFEFGVPHDIQRSQHLRQITMNFAEEINLFGPDMTRSALAELEQAMIIRFLLFSQHNYSALLFRAPPTASATAVERAENYIREHWNDPLDFDTLSRVTDTSVRSLFRTFKKMRGYTPSEYAKRIRLDQARIMIMRDNGLSIMAIAFKCGFQNVGRFAEEYHRQFGELPSHTRKNLR